MSSVSVMTNEVNGFIRKLIWAVFDEKNHDIEFGVGRNKRFVTLRVDLFNGELRSELGYHGPVERFGADYPMNGCIHTGGNCYYDSTGRGGVDFYRNYFVKGGPDAVFAALERQWQSVFGEEEHIQELADAEFHHDEFKVHELNMPS